MLLLRGTNPHKSTKHSIKHAYYTLQHLSAIFQHPRKFKNFRISGTFLQAIRI